LACGTPKKFTEKGLCDHLIKSKTHQKTKEEANLIIETYFNEKNFVSQKKQKEMEEDGLLKLIFKS